MNIQFDMTALAKRVAELGGLQGDKAVKADVAEIAKLETDWRAAWTVRNVTHTTSAAGARYRHQLHEQAEALKRGEKLLRSYGFSDIERDHTAKMEAAYMAMQHISAAAQVPAGRIHKKFIPIIETTIDVETKAEMTDAARFEFPFSPSPKLAALRELLDAMRKADPTLPHSAGASPAAMLPYINF